LTGCQFDTPSEWPIKLERKTVVFDFALADRADDDAVDVDPQAAALGLPDLDLAELLELAKRADDRALRRPRAA
jgi:hypothetical protein